MIKTMIAPYFLWLGIAVLALGLFGVVRLWPEGGLGRTFSQHVARRTSSVVYYTLLFTIALPLLAVFFYGWFIPEYQPHQVFGVVDRVALSLGALTMAYFLGLLVLTRAKHPKVLLVQVGYFASFFTSIIFVTL